MRRELMKPDHGLNDDAYKTFRALRANPKKKRRGCKKNKRQSFKGTYQQYINSKHWQRKREEALNHHGRKCNCCGRTYNLHVHHKHYRNLFREKMEDLEILCADCHHHEHEEKPEMDSLSREFASMFR